MTEPSSNPMVAFCVSCASERHVATPYARRPTIVQCKACALVFSAAEGSDVAENLYDENYYRGGVYADYLLARETVQRNGDRFLSEVEGLVLGRRILDVGCATGFFLEAAARRGWTVQGLEASPYASAHARELGLPVITGSIVEPPEGLAAADVVTLWDTIEHLERPDLALVQIRRVLQPGGILVVTTGDYNSLARRLMGSRWRLFEDPTHLFFFTPETLTLLLSRAGFNVVRMDHRGKRVGLGMILHQAPLPFTRALAAWVSARRWRMDLHVNAWDVMTVFAH